MALTEHTSPESSWTLRAIGWSVALLIIFTLLYKMMFKKQAVSVQGCLDQAASSNRPRTPAASVEKYAACVAPQSVTSAAAALSPRCKYAGVWSATRGQMIYQVTMEAEGRFIAEPAQNTPTGAMAISGAWNVAGKALVWAYDTGAVWPPDVNPLSAESDTAFTLEEVNGATTRYALIERKASAFCPQ
jgi:hypothetical protein